jgi:hypothetical protein
MRKLLVASSRILDPKTRAATAYYAALGMTLWDIKSRGFHGWNTLFLAALCGLSVAGTLGWLLGRDSKEKTPNEK